MQAEIKEIRNQGLVLKLDGEHMVWLPAEEWSRDPGGWKTAHETLDPGEELDVLIRQPARTHEGMPVVSRMRSADPSADASWFGQAKIMRVEELTRSWLRGLVGLVPVVAKQQPYYDYIGGKSLNEWVKDHGAIGPGDVVGGVVTGTADRKGKVELDLVQFLQQWERNPEPDDPGILAGNAAEADERVRQPELALSAEEMGCISPVLVVEDDVDCCNSIRDPLVRQGVEVSAATNVEEARQLLFRNPAASVPFRVTIIDLNLDPEDGDQNGFGLIRDLQPFPNCRIVMLTGEEFTQSKVDTWGKLRVHSYLLKPFFPEDVCGAVRQALDLDPAPWPELVGFSAPHPVETSPQPTEPSADQAVQNLASRCPGAVVHVFAIHQRSRRARSLLGNSEILNWVPYRVKIAKSVIGDTASSAVPLGDAETNRPGAHFWTRRMMKYEAFYGVPVRVKGPHRHALVAFHPKRGAFDDREFQAQARVCAEEVGRALERDALVKTRTDETAYTAVGMTMESLAHELRTDMVTVAAEAGELTRLLAEGAQPDPASVHRLNRSARSATEKVKALLGVRATREPVDLRLCVARAARRCRAVMGEIRHGGDIKIVMPELEPDQNWPVSAAPAALIIVFFNLYLNAAQQIDQMARAGIRQWGRISHSWETRLDDEDRRVAIVRIHDTGPGIHPDDWGRVFEPGYSTKPDGTGLGLYICRNLLSQIREGGVCGNLAVTRSVLWGGTTFTVTVPLCSETGAE